LFTATVGLDRIGAVIGERPAIEFMLGVNASEKVTESVLKPGQPFSPVTVILKTFPEVAPFKTVTDGRSDVTATHGTVHVVAQALLLKTVPVTTVSGIGTVLGGSETLTQKLPA
jgi:hypothetical protein